MVIKTLLNKGNFNKKLKASITVEAAFSFTITIFVLFMMIGPLLAIKTTSDMLISMNDASKVRSNYENIKYQAKNTEISEKIKNYIDENEFLNSNMKNIENIISYGSVLANYISKYGEDEREYRNIKYIYDINTNVYDEETGIIRYDFETCFDVPYNIFHISGIHKRLVNNRRAFIGADGNRFENLSYNGDYIYLADNYINSRIYHTYINCTYLIKDTDAYKYSEISSKRNEYNSRYSRCKYCFKNIDITNDTLCYVTQYGELYHFKSNCPLMTAYVTKKSIEFAEENNLTLCTRCKSKGNNE